jgi:hypothetical protein
VCKVRIFADKLAGVKMHPIVGLTILIEYVARGDPWLCRDGPSR